MGCIKEASVPGTRMRRQSWLMAVKMDMVNVRWLGHRDLVRIVSYLPSTTQALGPNHSGRTIHWLENPAIHRVGLISEGWEGGFEVKVTGQEAIKKVLFFKDNILWRLALDNQCSSTVRLAFARHSEILISHLSFRLFSRMCRCSIAASLPPNRHRDSTDCFHQHLESLSLPSYRTKYSIK